MSAPADDVLMERAVDWIVLLTSGQASDEDRQRFEHWLASHPEHARAWADVDSLMRQPLSRLRSASADAPGPVRAARAALLQTSGLDRRRVLKLAMLMAGVGIGALVTDRYIPLAGLSATYSTRTGERQTYTLEDGSLLTLNARSAADVRFDDVERTVLLRQGGLYAETRPDRRPFVVRTRYGDVAADQGRLTVEQFDAYAVAGAIENALTLRPGRGQALAVPTAGSAAFDLDHAWTRNDAAQASWRSGILSVRDARLDEVVAQLRAYQPGVIRLSARAAALRVFGVFPLDDPRRTLQALGDTLPIRVQRYGSWLTVVDSA
jgi:transmembrane sensor